MADRRFSPEATKILSNAFPGFTKMQLCMLNNPDKYGMYLSRKAERYLMEKGYLNFNEGEYEKSYHPKPKPNRKKNKSATVRFDEDTYNKLTKKIKELNCNSIQEFIEKQITKVIKEEYDV